MGQGSRGQEEGLLICRRVDRNDILLLHLPRLREREDEMEIGKDGKGRSGCCSRSRNIRGG